MSTLVDVLGMHRTMSHGGRSCSCGFRIGDLDPFEHMDEHIAGVIEEYYDDVPQSAYEDAALKYAAAQKLRADKTEAEIAPLIVRAQAAEERITRLDHFPGAWEMANKRADRWEQRARYVETDNRRLREMIADLGFCPKDGDPMPCMTCGAGL